LAVFSVLAFSLQPLAFYCHPLLKQKTLKVTPEQMSASGARLHEPQHVRPDTPS
jgi:hypothetical protein